MWEDAEVIDKYTREDALKDGVLIDVTPLSKEAGFRYPTAISSTLRNILDPTEDEYKMGQTFVGRLWDALSILNFAIKMTKEKTDLLKFRFTVARKDVKEDIEVLAHVGPGDNWEPVMTLMMQEDW